jgi:TM2 domain-containing membrane protein YozV
MAIAHKNKTLAVFFAAALGGTGMHRFYLRGPRAPWGWLHLAGLVATLIALAVFGHGSPVTTLLVFLPLTLSVLAGALQALLLGLTPDEKWDAAYNPASGRQTHSNWLLALLLVLTLAIGMSGLIFLITRSADLFATGGSYG